MPAAHRRYKRSFTTELRGSCASDFEFESESVLENTHKMPLTVSCRADDPVKHEFDVTNLLFTKGRLYSAGDDGKIKVWESDLRLISEVQAHPCSVFGLAASENTLYSASNDGTVKTWDLNTLQAKETLLNDSETEFWKVRNDAGVLYVGDNQGNVKIYKNEKLYGSINVAEPVKDLVVLKNLLFTVKDNDVIVTDLHLGGETVQFGLKSTLPGRGPLALIDDKLIFVSREGKDLILSTIGAEQHVKETSKVAGAHNLIINALSTANLDGGKSALFSGGWDKEVKQWRIDGDSLVADGSANVDIVVNALVQGESGQLYAAGGDGHIVRLDI